MPAAWKVEPRALCKGRPHHACWPCHRWNCIWVADEFWCCEPPGARDHMLSIRPTIWLTETLHYRCLQFLYAILRCHWIYNWGIWLKCWSSLTHSRRNRLSRSKQCYVHYIYWFNNCSKYISVLKAFGPVEDYHNIHTYYFGTVLSWSRKYIFRKKKT